MTTTLLAFHGKQTVKDFYLSRVTDHEIADQFIRGIYWDEDGHRGCSIGCTFHSSNHMASEIEIGVPVAIARLQDALFERMPWNEYETFTRELYETIPVGADLSMVVSRFMLWLLSDQNHGVLQYTYGNTRRCVQLVVDLHTRRISGDEPPSTKWYEAELACRSWVWPIVAVLGSSDWMGRAAWSAAHRIPHEVEALGWASWASIDPTSWYSVASKELLRLLAAAPVPGENND